MTSRTRIPPGLAATVLVVLIPGQIGAQGQANPALASSAPVEQTAQGPRQALPILDAFDGIGVDRYAGETPPRNPSDNSLAVGPDHLVQTVNSQMAVYTKRGGRFEVSGQLLFGPVATNAVFAGHGEVCGSRANGDAVVRYDQLAGRWLVVMPVFRRAVPAATSGAGPIAPPGIAARPGQASDPGPPAAPDVPPPPTAGTGATADGSYAVCYAVSTGADPLGTYHRYVFERRLFPDYPRPAVWPDGYYLPTSTGDEVIEKHVCVVDRARMLAGAARHRAVPDHRRRRTS